MSLAQEHIAVPPVRLEPLALRSRTASTLDTTMSLHSLTNSSGALYQSVYIGLLTCSVFDYGTNQDNVDYRTHQDNAGYLVELNVHEYGVRVYWKREREY